jgi:hypothetical protein
VFREHPDPQAGPELPEKKDQPDIPELQVTREPQVPPETQVQPEFREPPDQQAGPELPEKKDQPDIPGLPETGVLPVLRVTPDPQAE